jgi:hypothetical protein
VTLPFVYISDKVGFLDLVGVDQSGFRDYIEEEFSSAIAGLGGQF